MEYDIPAIVQGYARGYFLMANEEPGNSDVGWYSSRERAIVPLDDRFRYPRSLRRVLHQERFGIAVNRAFEYVVEGGADRETTWISPKLKRIYTALHQAGWAHSFETWQGDRLAGGILGIAIGGAFIGESMFYRVPEASKVAMVKLVERMRERGFMLFDAQLMNPHLARFGAYTLNEKKYQRMLARALARHCSLL
ncbi:leucyl/phenylalanyl-tRNA--protein transferase [Oscillatoriales cyanobacterium LEGE 11467]|uniref:Leucyl/phenylalanyl-tRNA--protein transferase n=1 Tax=Zarconia navalis LEGE 11467 TaxID=1828826 RepID=A0A928W2G6_9CYAN|nr:leucyl/phenylalanyl-tRNA--protein transferase [Zarconia navalis]MBE9042781.1 leucyl/phenylalanyl-tRNA--protein transferase [Zarconia navalis LEGE 11467]